MKSLPCPGSAGLGSSALTPPAWQDLQISTNSKGQTRPDGWGAGRGFLRTTDSHSALLTYILGRQLSSRGILGLRWVQSTDALVVSVDQAVGRVQTAWECRGSVAH